MSNTELNIINMADVEAVAVKWLWKPYIPLGKITIIQGDPGEGKPRAAFRCGIFTNGSAIGNPLIPVTASYHRYGALRGAGDSDNAKHYSCVCCRNDSRIC